MEQVMTKDCKTASAEMLAAEAVLLLEQNKINALLIVDADNKLMGALNIHYLFRAGVM